MLLTRLLSLTVAFVLVVPGAAFAAGPVTQPKVIVNEGFESESLMTYTVLPTKTGAAYWGRVPGGRASGSYGLWCAGTGGTWPGEYPKGSAGHADFNLGAALDLFSLDAHFFYKLPSRGDGDANSFSVLWRATGASEGDSELHTSFPLASDWVEKSYDLSTGSRSLARRGGLLRFVWADAVEGAGATKFQDEGVTIDDVLVNGWTYGPVRSLTGTVEGADVRLHWHRPYRAKSSTVLEDRMLTYDIWRAPAGTTTWQLMGSGIASPSSEVEYVDLSVPVGSYVYAVQTRGEGADSGYGVHVQSQPVAVIETGGPPVVHITSPDEGTVLTGSSQVIAGSASAAPGKTVSAVQVRISRGSRHWNGSAWQDAEHALNATLTGGGTSWSYNWQVPTSLSGDVVVSARAVDSDAGVGAYSSRTIAIDRLGPMLVRARSIGSLGAEILLSEPLDRASFSAGDFAIDGLRVRSAQLDASGTRVRIVTSRQQRMTDYRISVKSGAVRDANGNPNLAAESVFTGR